MSRPLHRWKSLWLGVLVVAFLLWAWWDSTHYSSFVRYRQFSLSHAGSGICLADWKQQGLSTSPSGQSSYSFGPSSLSPVPSFSWYRQQVPRTDRTWGRLRFEAPESFHCTGETGQISLYYQHDLEGKEFGPRNPAARHFKRLLSSKVPGSRAIYLPHWVIIAAFLIPWSTFLLWCWQRMKRLPAGAEGLPAQAPSRI